MNQITLNNKRSDVDIHINNAYEIIDQHLPYNYCKSVIEKLPKNTSVTKTTIHNVKKKLSKKRIDILNALVEVALENKEQKDKLIKIIS